ncbi:MAG: Xaa-Pro peptidase family protein [Desulfobacterales bacterium]
MDDIFQNRITRLRQRIAEVNLDALLVSIDENRRYLSGFTGEDTHFDESAGVLMITADRSILATDSRFTLQARKEAPLFDIHQYEKGLAKELPGLIARLDVSRIGFEDRRVSVFQHREMTREASEQGLDAEFVPCEDLVEQLRLIKDESEIALTRKALSVAEAAFVETAGMLEPGMTEKEIAWNLEQTVRRSGGDTLSFPTIVASGPNSALPHAVPGDRKIKSGEPILFDWGVRMDGYCSDTSRTLILGKPDDTFSTIHEIVRTAQRLAIAEIKPGAHGKAVDEIARTFIEDNGYKGKFGHGLGHGTGLAVHEGPRLSPLSTSILEPGMIVTVEPGIYIEKWGGVRIENQVVVREDGPEVLNRLDTRFGI